MSEQATGSLLRELRTKAGLTQEYLAKTLSVSRPKYTAIETGRTELSRTEIKKLADLYEISPTEIVEGRLALSDDFELDCIDEIAQDDENDIIPREVNPKVNIAKLQNILLYVLGKVGARPNVGETVLYKLLYFIDFDYYEKTGRSITGLSYVKNHYGPTPVREFSHIVQAMREAGVLEVVETPYFSHLQKKYLPAKNADLSSLSADEIKHIDTELERLGYKSANELTELSHKDTPWIAAKQNKRIDYQLAMYRTDDTSVRDYVDEL